MPSSGRRLPLFRGKSGLQRDHKATKLNLKYWTLDYSLFLCKLDILEKNKFWKDQHFYWRGIAQMVSCLPRVSPGKYLSKSSASTSHDCVRRDRFLKLQTYYSIKFKNSRLLNKAKTIAYSHSARKWIRFNGLGVWSSNRKSTFSKSWLFGRGVVGTTGFILL